MSSNQQVEARAESNVNLQMLEGVHTGQASIIFPDNISSIFIFKSIKVIFFH